MQWSLGCFSIKGLNNHEFAAKKVAGLPVSACRSDLCSRDALEQRRFLFAGAMGLPGLHGSGSRLERIRRVHKQLLSSTITFLQGRFLLPCFGRPTFGGSRSMAMLCVAMVLLAAIVIPGISRFLQLSKLVKRKRSQVV
jgi:hypothetical protein